jgi:hypothetical protein
MSGSLYAVSDTFDERMEEALEMVERAANPRGRWRAASQPGKTYLVHEKNGSEGRWNTLRALRVLGYYGYETDNIEEKNEYRKRNDPEGRR